LVLCQTIKLSAGKSTTCSDAVLVSFTSADLPSQTSSKSGKTWYWQSSCKSWGGKNSADAKIFAVRNDLGSLDFTVSANLYFGNATCIGAAVATVGCSAFGPQGSTTVCNVCGKCGGYVVGSSCDNSINYSIFVDPTGITSAASGLCVTFAAALVMLLAIAT
jgi:hypothetical protein